MTVEEFRASTSGAEPVSATLPLRALWHDARGDWDLAHRLAQDCNTPDGAWVHAYLHRKEGDLGNARYWYRRANRPEATGPIEAEWRQLVESMLAGLR